MKFSINNNLFFYSKKALSMSIQTIVTLIIIFFVIFIVTSQYKSFTDTTSGGLSDFKLKSIIEKCEISNGRICDVISCSEGTDNKCDDIEKSTWVSFKDYHTKCLNPSLENYDKLNCGVLFEKISEVIDSQITNSGNYNGPKSDIEIKKLLGSNIELIESFANKHSIDPNKLIALISVESSANAFDGDHPTVRFECLKYNQRTIKDSEKVSCKTDIYKYGNSEDTNKAAFLRALEINSENAMLSSSYGLAQIIGENYDLIKYPSVKKYYEDMFNEEKQIEAFLIFISQSSMIFNELKSDDTDWANIAESYNGKNYADNNYDVKLKNTYESLIA
jgi:hypothetical protein